MKLYLILILSSVNAYNILVYSPAFGSSHSTFMGRLADTLTAAGHNVTLLVPVGDVTRRNFTGTKTTTDIVFVDQDKIAEKRIVSPKSDLVSLWTKSFNPEDIEDTVSVFHKNTIETCANLIRNPEIFEEMKSRNFDVVLAEPLSVCGTGFAYRLGIRRMIQTSSCTFFDFMNMHLGEPEEHSYVPSLFGQTGEQMDLWERYENFKTIRYLNTLFDKLFDAEEQLYTKNYQVKLPPWRELLALSSMQFTNANPNLDFPRPTIQKTIMIGGISVNMESQKLDENWERVLGLRNKTMLISFGSMVRSMDMPITYRKTMLKVLQSFPEVTFIWKYELDETKWADHVANIHFSKWVPQTALLKDKRITAFLTHGGLGSTNELAYTGKPALMVPIAWDQGRNANMLARLGAAIAIKKSDLDNFDLLRASIQSLLYDESYTKNAKRIAEILESQPVKPEELVVKHTEFVAQFGPFSNMDPYVRKLNYIQRSGLDVRVMFYSGPIMVVLLILIVLRIFSTRLEFTVRKRKTE